MNFKNSQWMLESLNSRIPYGRISLGGSEVLPFLLHHCVLEIRFKRLYKPRTTTDMLGRVKTEYRQRSPRGRVYVSPYWYGKEYRRMMCTLDPTVLKDVKGSAAFGFYAPKGVRNPPLRPGLITVWDLLWQDWRVIPVETAFDVTAIIPTCVYPEVKSGRFPQKEGQIMIAQEREIFWRIVAGNFADMSPMAKIAYMDDKVELNLQDQERKLRLALSAIVEPKKDKKKKNQQDEDEDQDEKEEENDPQVLQDEEDEEEENQKL